MYCVIRGWCIHLAAGGEGWGAPVKMRKTLAKARQGMVILFLKNYGTRGG
jgi:hypothetical protein